MHKLTQQQRNKARSNSRFNTRRVKDNIYMHEIPRGDDGIVVHKEDSAWHLDSGDTSDITMSREYKE